MIADLKPYAEYKDSGQRWLGQIPAAWQLRRAKFLFREIDERSKTGKEELLSVSHKTGVTPRSEKSVTMFLAKSNVGHKLCRPQNLVINTLWAWMAALGVSRHKGIVSPAYGVYRPLSPNQFLPRFADFLLRTPTYAAEYQRCSTGVNSSRLRLYPEYFLRIPVLLPCADEQAAIVRFLEWANGRLERAIRAKRKQMALVRERVRVETEQALRSGGVLWKRLSTIAEVMSRPIDRQDNKVYTRIGLYNRGRGIFHKPAVPGTHLGESEFFTVCPDDFVISGQFAWEGAVALARAKDLGCIASHRYPILRGHDGIVSSAFLLSLFRSSYGVMLLDHHSRGAAGRNRPLNAQRLLKETIPIPPRAAQNRIELLLEQEHAVSQSVEGLVTVINEYRTRLVADVVTGKLDVRAAAAKLPDETHEPEMLDDADALTEGDEETGDADLDAVPEETEA